jgi:hypothetical protein
LQEPAWLVHRHPWPLTSLVVRGAIRDERYSVADDPGGGASLYEAVYDGDQSVLRAVGRCVTCNAVTSDVLHTGDIYEVPVDAFHASEAERPSVTIAESGPPIDRSPQVVGAAYDEDVVRYRRRELAATELAAVLSEVWLAPPSDTGPRDGLGR